MIKEANGRFICTKCGYEWSAMLGDSEIPSKCSCETDSKITATFKGDFTGFVKEFDVTKQILKMSISEIKKFEDHQVETDWLAPESIIEEAREAFKNEWGKGFKNCEFGFEVEVVDSICEYFGISDLSELNSLTCAK